MRLLDSKDERDQPFKDGAPKLIDHLSPEARGHHETVLAALESAGITYSIDPLLVRGLDYYNRTVFEIVPDDDERAQGTIGGGGRYDGLFEMLGGPPTPGIGFGSGIERIILEMQKNGVQFAAGPAAEVYIVHRAAGAAAAAFALANAFRDAGVAAVLGETGKSFKAQMRAPTRARHGSQSSSARTSGPAGAPCSRTLPPAKVTQETLAMDSVVPTVVAALRRLTGARWYTGGSIATPPGGFSRRALLMTHGRFTSPPTAAHPRRGSMNSRRRCRARRLPRTSSS